MDGINLSAKNFAALSNFAAYQSAAIGFKHAGHQGPPGPFHGLPFDIPGLQAAAGLYPTALAAAPPRSPSSYGGVMEMSAGEAAEAKLVDYRGEKVAGFEVDGETLICLPQAFDLFLKTLVGGLHTVYTKLKRLDIQPRVCNVEQVRALRSLGAIQPGVNRCKLIACKDFDVLYEDCTSANCSARPGRPPKKSPVPFVSSSGMHIPKRPKMEAMQDKSNGPTLPGHHPWGSPLFPMPAQFSQQMMMNQLQLNAANMIMAKQMAHGADHQSERNGEMKHDDNSEDQTHSQLLSSPNGAMNLSKPSCATTSSASPTDVQTKAFHDHPVSHSTDMQANGMSEDYYSDPESANADREQAADVKTPPSALVYPHLSLAGSTADRANIGLGVGLAGTSGTAGNGQSGGQGQENNHVLNLGAGSGESHTNSLHSNSIGNKASAQLAAALRMSHRMHSTTSTGRDDASRSPDAITPNPPQPAAPTAHMHHQVTKDPYGYAAVAAAAAAAAAEQHGGHSAPGIDQNGFPCNVVDAQLGHIRGFIDVLSVLIRGQLEQVQKEKWELTKALDQERTDRRQTDTQLQEALRLKIMYQKRWKRLRRSQRPFGGPAAQQEGYNVNTARRESMNHQVIAAASPSPAQASCSHQEPQLQKSGGGSMVGDPQLRKSSGGSGLGSEHAASPDENSARHHLSNSSCIQRNDGNSAAIMNTAMQNGDESPSSDHHMSSQQEQRLVISSHVEN